MQLNLGGRQAQAWAAKNENNPCIACESIAVNSKEITKQRKRKGNLFRAKKKS